LKDSRALPRKVERALNPYDHEALSEAAARYEAALDPIATQTAGSTKDLTRAARTLDSQIEKIERLEASGPESGRETVAWLLDAAAVAHDSISAELDGLAPANRGGHEGGHQGGHGSEELQYLVEKNQVCYEVWPEYLSGGS